MQLLGLVPMHSDSQQFVRVAGWFETFTAVTRFEPFLLRRPHLLGIGILAHLTTTCVRPFLVHGGLVLPGNYFVLGKEESRLIPHDQPMARCYSVCRISVANTADCAGFADSTDS